MSAIGCMELKMSDPKVGIHNHLVIGVSGGSCAGKTTFAQELHRCLGEKNSTIICQDWYYHDLSRSMAMQQDPHTINFDEPSSIDFEFMYQQLLQLLQGKMIFAPRYDFCRHARLSTAQPVESKRVLIVDGTLILSQWHLRQLFNYSVFLDIAEGIRIKRRINRDVLERGREKPGILHQFESQVQPMHFKFVEPHKETSSYVVTNDKTFYQVIAVLIQKVQSWVYP